jgi:dihydrolipoamide dehydrogenase
VIGAGPAGVMASLRAAELGASVTLVTDGAFGGMAANDGPIPVRTLAHASRLMLLARSLERYGIEIGAPSLSYPRLLERVHEVIDGVAAHSTLRADADRLGVTVHEHVGPVRFVSPHEVRSANGLVLDADRFILCAGGTNRRLGVPGEDLTVTHRDALALTAAPPSLLVVGGGMTGLQVASIYSAFGSRVAVFQRGPRILPDEDRDVSAAVAEGLRARGIEVDEDFDRIDAFEKTPQGVRMQFTRAGIKADAEATLAVVAVGWIADTHELGLSEAGIASDARGFVQVDERLATSAPHVFAAGDITGRSVLVPPAVLDAHRAATHAVLGGDAPPEPPAIPMGGFTDPEYAHVGVTQDQAPGDAVVGIVRFDETARTIIDGRTPGFVKLIADRSSKKILGCHVVGERAADIVQAAAIAMAGGLGVDELAKVPLAFPTYVGVLTRAAYRAARQADTKLESPTVRVLI